MTKYEDVPQFGNLKGMKVVVSAVSTAGPFAGELFAENGADVIWLESPKGIDPYRWTQDGWGVQNERRNMRNLMLDVVSPAGHEVFLKLIETADIFIRSLAWKPMGKMGLQRPAPLGAQPPPGDRPPFRIWPHGRPRLRELAGIRLHGGGL